MAESQMIWLILMWCPSIIGIIINPSLILVRDKDVLVRQGLYDLRLTLQLTDLERGGNFLRGAVSNYKQTCNLLSRQEPRVKCGRTGQNLESAVSQFIEREGFIKSFFFPSGPKGYGTL